FPSIRLATSDELTFRYGYVFDVFQAPKTHLLRSHPFPMGPPGLLVPEGVLWHDVSGPHPWLLVDEKFSIYFTGAGYERSDQLSWTFLNPLREQAPGMVLGHGMVLDRSFALF